MFYTVKQLLSLSNTFEELSTNFLIKSAQKRDNKKKEYSNSAKDKSSSKKLDPKAKVRNRGDVCIPAEKAKDKKDHFPINDADQARNALSQVAKYTNVPDWYHGSLISLQNLVKKKVHSKYPSIGKEKKKSAYYESLLSKFAQDNTITSVQPLFLPVKDWVYKNIDFMLNLPATDKNIDESIQKALNRLGYGNLIPDGVFGKQTKKAIDWFMDDKKAAHQLTNDSTVEDIFNAIKEEYINSGRNKTYKDGLFGAVNNPS